MDKRLLDRTAFTEDVCFALHFWG